jgi:hypothetical protein
MKNGEDYRSEKYMAEEAYSNRCDCNNLRQYPKSQYHSEKCDDLHSRIVDEIFPEPMKFFGRKHPNLWCKNVSMARFEILSKCYLARGDVALSFIRGTFIIQLECPNLKICLPCRNDSCCCSPAC